MTELLKKIEIQLKSLPENNNLIQLFCETLLWGKASSKSFIREINFGNNQISELCFNPIAQLSGLPILQVDWPRENLPNVTQRRTVHSNLSKIHLEHILVYTTQDGKQASFVWAQKREDKKIELRSLPYEVDQPARTTIEQLGQIAFNIDELGMFGDPGIVAVTDKLKAAFDVEKVTRQFFRQYADIFRDLEKDLSSQIEDDDERNMFTQRLFNRLLFLCFIQKRRWLNNDLGYLFSLYDDAIDKGLNFFSDYLYYLLFWGLSNIYKEIPSGMSTDQLKEKIGNVPFLNGGLFEIHEPWDTHNKVVIDTDTFEPLLGSNGLLRRYNFTVMESTPLDIEVAVDPEMLGKVFEELVTGRHATGSYYTPQPVVSFMCKESLKGYLTSIFPDKENEAIVEFVDHRLSDKLSDPESILDSLKRITVCDPACGSGAYLLGMLHELLELRESLFVKHEIDHAVVFERRLEIIKNNIYGVDIDRFAVEIAKLRLWLSLVVDSDYPLPLPNLDFKIGVGDSLTAPNPEGGLELGFRKSKIDELKKEKEKYLVAHGEEKLEIKSRIDTLRSEIQEWSGYTMEDDTFDWVVDFAEIFTSPSIGGITLKGAMRDIVNMANGQMELSEKTRPYPNGFDIVIANPPYVRADAQYKHIKDNKKRQTEILKLKTYRKRLKESNIYNTLFEKWDLYIPFLERAFQLLKSKGNMIYIVSDAYNAAKYASRSQEFFLDNCSIERIDFCSDIPLFEAGVFNSILHFKRSIADGDHIPTRIRRWGEKSDDFSTNYEVLETRPQINFGTRLFRLKEKSTYEYFLPVVPLSSIFYISYGLRANAHDKYWKGEFVTADLISNNIDKTHPKKYIEGKDIVPYGYKRIRYIEWGTDRAPRKFARPTFPELHEAKQKLIALVVADKPPAMYDSNQLITTHTACIFVPWHNLQGIINRSINKSAKYRHQAPEGDREIREATSLKFKIKYVLAVMNSTFSYRWICDHRRSKNHVYPDDWKTLPIPEISIEDQKIFAELVDRIIDLKIRDIKFEGSPIQTRVEDLEAEIDRRVAILYGIEI